HRRSGRPRQPRQELIALYRDAYPEITFLTHEDVKPEHYYATYSLGLFFDDKDNIYRTNSLATLNPTSSYRALSVALARTAGRRDFPVLNQDPPRTALARQPAPARAEPSDGAVR